MLIYLYTAVVYAGSVGFESLEYLHFVAKCVLGYKEQSVGRRGCDKLYVQWSGFSHQQICGVKRNL